VRIATQGSAFCYPEHIDREMRRLFTDLAEQGNFKGVGASAFALKAAHLLAELNAIHPFREGNGRTQLAFVILLAERAGHALELKPRHARAVLSATIASFDGNEEPLAALIHRLLT
jgi:cell filamentation protein